MGCLLPAPSDRCVLLRVVEAFFPLQFQELLRAEIQPLELGVPELDCSSARSRAPVAPLPVCQVGELEQEPARDGPHAEFL